MVYVVHDMIYNPIWETTYMKLFVIVEWLVFWLDAIFE